MKRGLLILAALFVLAGTAHASFYTNPSGAWGTWTGTLTYSGLVSGTQDGTFTLGDTQTISFTDPYYLYVPASFPPDTWNLADNSYLSGIQGTSYPASPTQMTYSAILNAIIDTGTGTFTITNAIITALFTFSYDDATGKATSMNVSGTVMDSTGSFAFATATGTFSPTPIPGAIWLLGSGLVGLFGMRRRFLAA